MTTKTTKREHGALDAAHVLAVMAREGDAGAIDADHRAVLVKLSREMSALEAGLSDPLGRRLLRLVRAVVAVSAAVRKRNRARRRAMVSA